MSRVAVGLGFRGQKSETEAQRVIERAIDCGINFIDCANVYRVRGEPHTRSEEILSRVLKTKRDQVVITSKVAQQIGEGPNDQGCSRYHIMHQVEQSLRRLATDHIDVYLLHVFDAQTPIEESIGALDDLMRQGKVRYAGCCNYAAWQVCKALWTVDRMHARGLVCVQNPYNLLRRDLENEMFPLVRDQSLGVMVFSPLAIGLLSGVYQSDQAPPVGSVWAKRDPSEFEAALSGASTVLGRLRAIARDRGKTMAQVAQNWVLSHPEVTAIISGSDTEEQIEENVGAVGWELCAEEIELLNDATDQFRRTLPA